MSDITNDPRNDKVVETKRMKGATYSVDITQYQPTQRPIEDRYSLDHVHEVGKDRLILGVYDGHGGPATADYVSKLLPRLLAKDSPSAHASIFKALDRSIMNTFMKDHSILRAKSAEWIANAELVKQGCMALVCDVDLETKLAVVSNAGDCRLLVIRQGEVIYQTVDLNAKSSAEVDRLVLEHPNEDMLVVGGRLFGRLMSTRGFGDGYYKIPEGPQGILNRRKHRQYIDVLSSIEPPGKVPMNAQYDSIFYGYRTPPYITASPETSSISLEPGDILVAASDGLWDVLSSVNVAQFVGSNSREVNMALGILHRAIEAKPPGDDVTILVAQID